MAAPYVQILFLNRIFVLGGGAFSPSLLIATLVLFSAKMPLSVTYTYAFLLGVISSIIYGVPAGMNAISYLLIVLFIIKFASNFDITGFMGQFILGAAASLFNFIYLLVLSSFMNVSSPVFFNGLLSIVLTGGMLIILFMLFFTGRKSIV